MPGVDWKLDEQPMAGLLGDIRQALDSRAPLVDAATAAAVRKDVQTADLPAHDHKRCPLSDRNALMRAIAAKVSDAEIDAADDMQNLP